ncbi:hypothetical protein ACO0LC_02865 [Undibacterium sp. JH2W]|uniref:hypothetical protein n=1 Tax=Undibacterium sp. JH2W TaxID=3413037 RepID=UPI003BF3F68E
MVFVLATHACAGGLDDLGKAAELLKAASKNPATTGAGRTPATENRDATAASYSGLEGEAVVTGAPVSGFAEAQERRIISIHDGDPVFFHVRLPRPLKDYVFPTFVNDRPGLILTVGPRGIPGQQHNSIALFLRETEMNGSELHLNLAPGEIRKSSMHVWMETVGGGSHGIWDNEIRLLGRNNKLLAVAPLTAEVNDGIDKYKAMTKEYRSRFVVGDPASNEAPPNIHRNDMRLAVEVSKQASQLLGNKPDATYFTDDGWAAHTNRIGQIEYHITTATALFSTVKKVFYQNLNVKKYPGNGRIDVELDGKPRELNTDNYKRALVQAR